MESRGPEDSKNVKTSQAYFFEGFISFFEDFSLTISVNTSYGKRKKPIYLQGHWALQRIMALGSLWAGYSKNYAVYVAQT